MTATFSRAYNQICSYFRSEPLREPLDKPVEIPEVKMEVVHQYGKIGTREVSLMRRGDELGYQVTDTSTAETKRVKIPDGANPQPIESRISNYIEKEAIFDPDGKTVHFLSPIFKWNVTLSNGSSDNSRWALVFELKNTLVALFFDKNLGRFQANFKPGTYKFSDRTCEEAKACLNNVTAASWKIFNLYKLIFVKVFEKIGLPFNQSHGFELCFEPKSSPSKIDPRIQVSRFLWGVTLINRGRSTDEFPIENHAQIVIEGLDKNANFFVRYAHFNRDGVQTNKITNPNSYAERTALFKTNGVSTKKMVKVIKEQKRSRYADFYITGHSIITLFFNIFKTRDYHNCYTWALEKLRSINIRYPCDGLFYNSIKDIALPLSNFKSSTHPEPFACDPNIDKV